MKLAVRLALITFAMTAFLTFMAVRAADLRAHGTEIIMPMEPVDPRDILLGYYVIIRTPAHRIDTQAQEGPQTGWAPGEVIYVTLRETADGWRPTGAFREKPSQGVFLQGRVRRARTVSDMREVEPDIDKEQPGRIVREPIPGTERQELDVAYNLERYYTDSETAQELEGMRRQDRLRHIVSVGEDGAALLKGLDVDGLAPVETLF